ncbi:MAG: CocE/NonD family hydrolase [Chloroflexota bacterium]
MKKRWLLTLFALTGLGLYGLRRRLLGRLLHIGPPQNRVSVRRGLRTPLPGGPALVGDLYRPQRGGRRPTVLMRTPYGRTWRNGISGIIAHFAALRFAERGYNVLLQEVRGSGDSAGPGERFVPFQHEAADGRATLAWIERQEWSDGATAMWGPSYLGYTQWAAAAGAPASLKAFAPAMTGARMTVMGLRDGAPGFDLQLRWIHTLQHLQPHGLLTWLPCYYRTYTAEQRAVARAERELPLAHADEIVAGQPVPFFREWLDHTRLDDPYWQAVDPTQNFNRLHAAASLVSGWYDLFLREALDDYCRLRQAGAQPYLTIGPWRHADIRSVIESLRQSLAWFDAHLRGDPRRLRLDPVWVYVQGQEAWQALPDWPPPTRPLCGYLHPDRALDFHAPPMLHPLAPRRPGAAGPACDHYTYDPADPTPAIGGNMQGVHGGRVDNRLLEARPDVLCYTSPPLQASLLVMGAPRAVLYVRSSRPTADFFVRLCDVHPHGASYNICDGLLRVGPEQGQAQPDGSRRIEVELFPTAYRFARGHRLRVQVSSGAHPRWARNLGGDEPCFTARRMYRAEQTIYHDLDHPSAVSIPCAADTPTG